MIQLATQQMLPQLKTIWEACFGDPRTYTDFIFTRIATPDKVLVSTDGTGEPVAMLCMQPFWLTSPGELQCRSAYIFGVATLPRCQGKGLSTKLLEAAHLHLSASGAAASVLVPASESLIRFYGGRGYEKAFPIRKGTITGDEIPPAEAPCVLVPSSLKKLEGMRNQIYAHCRLYARWGGGYLAAIDEECTLSGGEVLQLSCHGKQGFAVCYGSGTHITVKELAVEDSILPSVLAAIHARYKADEYTVYLQGDKGFEFFSTVLPFGMVRWYDREMKERFAAAAGSPAYLAHVLD